MNALQKRLIGGTLVAAVAGTITQFEGYSTTPYYDSAGVLTVCYGSTGNVIAHQKLTDAQCMDRLKVDIAEHSKALTGLPSDVPDAVLLGSIDMAYNIGVYGFSNSTAAKRLAVKDYTGAGKAVLRWKYITVNGTKYDCSVAGNKVCSGLWKRRVWQSKAIGNEFKTLDEAVKARDELLRG